MVLPSIYSLSGSPDLGRHVQDRLRKVQQKFPASRNEFRVVADKLSAIDEACCTVMKRLEAQDETYDAVAAFTQVERALDWAEFLEEVQANPIPTERTLLFRAHQSNTTIQLGIYDSFACETSFGDQYQQQKSVEDFISSLGNHLGKTEREKEAGEPWETMFTSTSPRLDWTVHLTEQKWRKQEKQGMEDHVGFVTFDLQKLSETPDLTVLRVANVLRFLETRGKSRLIPFQYRKWAKNCDEYVLVGRNIQHSMLQISPWTKLQSMPIINDCFSYAYTLKRYDELWDAFMDEQSKRELGEACDMVVESAKTLADQKADDDAELVQNLVELIIKPGVRFWGIKTLSTDVEIKAGCKRMLEDELVVGMSRMSVRES